MTRAHAVPLVLLAAAAGGCLDAVGHEEDVQQRSDVQALSQPMDDDIAAKHPVFDASRTVTETFGQTEFGCDVALNKSAAVTKLDIVPFAASEAALDGTLFHGRGDALDAATGVQGLDVIPSTEVVNGNLKPFDDGLYAAVELDVEDGKSTLLTTLLARLAALSASADATVRPALDDASAMVGAALRLGGASPALDAALASRAQARIAQFQAEPQYASPDGFYTWTPALAHIFARDRFLQNGDEKESFGAYAAVAYVLGQDAALLADYQQVTALYAGLTNPYVTYAIDALIPFVPSTAALADVPSIESAFKAAKPPPDPCVSDAPVMAFLPASRSKEVDFFDGCGADAGTGTLLDRLTAAIQNGTVDLAPGTDSGWYDYQLYALETSLVPQRAPEDQNLFLTAGYKKKLIETFKSILIQDRETHIKQLAGARAASYTPPPVDVYPLLPAEPFPTYYLRTARGYRFLRTFLEATLGSSFLGANARLVEGGARAGATLADELDQRIQLLYGLAFLTADAVGMNRTSGVAADELAEIDPDTAAAAARSWLERWRTDADVLRDPRVIVPLLATDDGVTTYEAVVGVKAIKARAAFVSGHEPVVTPTGCWTGNLVPHDYTLLVEETAEVRLPTSRPPPTRAELRAVCDAHATKDAIVSALESQ